MISKAITVIGIAGMLFALWLLAKDFRAWMGDRIAPCATCTGRGKQSLCSTCRDSIEAGMIAGAMIALIVLLAAYILGVFVGWIE